MKNKAEIYYYLSFFPVILIGMKLFGYYWYSVFNNFLVVGGLSGFLFLGWKSFTHTRGRWKMIVYILFLLITTGLYLNNELGSGMRARKSEVLSFRQSDEVVFQSVVCDDTEVFGSNHSSWGFFSNYTRNYVNTPISFIKTTRDAGKTYRELQYCQYCKEGFADICSSLNTRKNVKPVSSEFFEQL